MDKKNHTNESNKKLLDKFTFSFAAILSICMPMSMLLPLLDKHVKKRIQWLSIKLSPCQQKKNLFCEVMGLRMVKMEQMDTVTSSKNGLLTMPRL